MELRGGNVGGWDDFQLHAGVFRHMAVCLGKFLLQAVDILDCAFLANGLPDRHEVQQFGTAVIDFILQPTP